jgi:NADH-quinone oxidoreductase subunit M
MITILLALLLIGAFASLFYKKNPKMVALTATLLVLLVLVVSLFFYSFNTTTYQFEENVKWIDAGSIKINYHLGIDGLSYPLILLTALLGFAAVLVSFREVKDKENSYYSFLMLLEASIIGVFASLDLFLFYVFWESVLIFMFLLILIWGLEDRKYAAMKFFIYTHVGSLVMLFIIIMLFFVSGTFSIPELAKVSLPVPLQMIMFSLLLFVFFIKMPIVPLHTWLPDAHVQAPTAGSMMLAGVLLKMGGYGLLRLGVGLFPKAAQQLSTLMLAFGIMTIIYGAIICLMQTNLKRLIAYSSISHMGYVLVGISTLSALGFSGAIFGMVSHGLLAALLFGLAGAIHQRTGTFELSRMKGLATSMPVIGWLFVVAGLGAIGLPGMTGFVAEFMVMLSAFNAFGLIALLALLGMISNAAYMVLLLQKTFFGPRLNLKLNDAGINFFPFALLLLFVFILGIFPKLLVAVINTFGG